MAEQRWLRVDAWISTIDGAAVVQVDTSALDQARRCRVYVNDGAVYDAVPSGADHDTGRLADDLTELGRGERVNLARGLAAARTRRPDLPEWPYHDVGADDLGRVWPLITVDQIAHWAGTALTGDEIDRVARAIPKSSIPKAIGDIVAAITADRAGAHNQHDAAAEAGETARCSLPQRGE
ncbi:hypothetical protein [Nocardia cyriacigeorgica]|uniref:hypothetical protein n=1 Tax=Nocardia cyriacigeorgica TaxID=135487 RepID=UPI001893CA24|nr:hypothetical protein [Nocardia cyriacigeorgica]MBF6477168.1 hypothetical protein [Nocardia cyriacigeorgica]